MKPDPNALADYIHPAKYARHLPNVQRRETYEETVTRVLAQHVYKYPQFNELISKAFNEVYDKRVVPSMRAMQFAGLATLKNNARQYNCTASPVDRPRVFAEALWLLLCGCGVGFSVQRRHVDKLPPLASRSADMEVIEHDIEDTIEGWADALNALVDSFVKGYKVKFWYHLIRPRGAPLKTSGGRAPGHAGLKKSLEAIERLLEGAAGRKLRPIECHDIICLASEAVLSGGVRRSASISLFDIDDEEMINAKTGNWNDTHPYRAYANNSAMIHRSDVNTDKYFALIKAIKEWGEPGFVFTNDYDYLYNPCVEAGLHPFLQVTKDNLQELRDAGVAAEVGDRLSGWQMCNLCEINVAACETPEQFEQAARAATVIGTLQASYTDFPYLGKVSELIVRNEALLGVGLTGVLDNPTIGLNTTLLQRTAKKVVEWNREIALLLGINPAARTTLAKPSGTSSLVLKTSSGVHPHRAPRYIRRVTANDTEPVFLYFQSINPTWCVQKPNGDWVIEFPVQARDNAITWPEVNALQFLDIVKTVQESWVIPGTARHDTSPGLTHNVSNTVLVREDEWEQVAEFILENKNTFGGISLLPRTADKAYAFAPEEAIVTVEDEVRWEELNSTYTPVDYTKMVEIEDVTSHTAEAACAGGACSVM